MIKLYTREENEARIQVLKDKGWKFYPEKRGISGRHESRNIVIAGLLVTHVVEDVENLQAEIECLEYTYQ